MTCCVYLHRHPETNEIVYIGHGSIDRAYSKSYRNSEASAIAWMNFENY